MYDGGWNEPIMSFTPSKNKVFFKKQRMKQLQDEIFFLQTLVGDMNNDIEEMKIQRI